MTISGAVNETIDWNGDPWLGVCGGIAGGAGGGMVGLFFMGDAITDSPLDTFVSIEADPGDTGEFPLTLMMTEDFLGYTGDAAFWVSSDQCTATLTRNAPVAPGLFAVEGTGSCTAPLDSYPPDAGAITVEGTFSFSGVVIFGDVASETLVDCCYGG
jgi:hypothetical protein